MSQILTFNSGGSGGIPIVQIDGDVGSAVGPIISLLAEPTSGSSVSFSAAGSTVRFFVTDTNINTIIGNNAGNGTISGTNNTALGKDALTSLTSGSDNIAIGLDAMNATTAGSGNIVIGGGDANLNDIGSNNIVIGSVNSFPAATSNTTAIGNSFTSKCAIGGINGVSLGNTATVVTMGGTDPDELGTAVITAGVGITVTPTANTITISTSGSGFSWNDVISGSANLVAENGYVIHNAGATTLTMPTSASLGDTIQIVGRQGIWAIIYGIGQYIQFGTQDTTITSGQLSATNASDCVTLVCIIPSGTVPIFAVTTSIGNITVA